MANSKSDSHTDKVKRPSKALGMYLPKISPADDKPDPLKKLNPFIPLPPINHRSRSWGPVGRPSSTDGGPETERHGRLGSIGSHVGLQGSRHSRRSDCHGGEQRPGFDSGRPNKHLRVSINCGMDEERDGVKGCDDRLDSTSRWVNGQEVFLLEGHRGKGSNEDGGEDGFCDSAADETDVEGPSSMSSDLPGNGVDRGEDGGDGCVVGDGTSRSVGEVASFSTEKGHLSLASGKNRKLFTGIAKTSRAYFAQNIN